MISITADTVVVPLARESDASDTCTTLREYLDANLIVFSPRQASRLARLSTGNVATDLLTGADRPTLVLPTDDGV